MIRRSEDGHLVTIDRIEVEEPLDLVKVRVRVKAGIWGKIRIRIRATHGQLLTE
jgi:hypothetical protein